MFGKSRIREDYARAIDEINNGQRRTPKHDIPTAGQIAGKFDPIDLLAFEEFAWLGMTLDWATDEAWSFEETSNTVRRASYLELPAHGRRWIVHYNGLRMGWAEVSAAPAVALTSLDEYRADPRAQVDMTLSLMRFISWDAAFEILFQTAFFMQSTTGGYDAARERARHVAESALTRYMWDVMHADEQYVPDLEFSAAGPYSVFRETVSHWKKTGFRPFQPR